MLEELSKENYFEEEMSMTDVNKMTDSVKSKLNKVISKLAPAKRIQIKRTIKDFKCPEAKEKLKEADKAKTHAIKTKDQEDFRGVFYVLLLTGSSPLT